GVIVTTDTESSSDGEPSTSSDDESSTDDESEPPTCDYPALHDCTDPAELAYLDCRASCPDALLACDDGACVSHCELSRSSAIHECQLDHCSAPQEDDECVLECWTEFSSCVAAPSCGLHACQWELGPCLTSCVQCIVPTELDFAYADSCQLLLPEPPGSWQFPAVMHDGEELRIEDTEAECAEPQVGGIIEGASISLCAATCEAFSLAGVIRVLMLGPACP
ncbi:MAG TPA: hypothetical protein VM869_28875, partial [Enhygromyxa sp.]|nr:hypothetical protein [Enhygromyxa sp.]